MTETVEIPDIEYSSASLVARWVLMCSHLYYDRGVSLVDDATYDELCRQAAEHFDSLPQHLQVQLGDPAEIVSTGMGVWLSRQTIAAAERLAFDVGEGGSLGPYKERWEYECECCGCDLTPIRG